ncbi:AraC family transcriptional regulator [Paenibacillus sp.]|uniref:AraC family transcriptional regulator n=1 Tax=Paenibacillus sp. TaxID=58172 RepID=UPI002D504AD3|nr:helix-turn-helix domain-containing protein [Paenibacillus sp.]HZG83688.1 helix-turn-helix domain-containing protein [Paenibacillus sp.]
MEDTRGIPEGFAQQRLYLLPDYTAEALSRHPLTRGAYVSDIGVFPKARRHYRERREGSDAHIVIYCADGRGWVRSGGGPHMAVGPRQLVVLPPAAPHAYGADADDPWSIYWFHLKGDEAGALLAEFRLLDRTVQLPAADADRFLERFQDIYETLTEKSYSMAHHVYVSQALRFAIAAIGAIQGRTRREERTSAYLETAIAVMKDRLDGRLTLRELAEKTRLSPQHLNQLFKEETGFPPVEYYLRLKMRRASELLDVTTLGIKEIAAAVGIADPYYFSRLFKRTTGEAPSEYRKRPKG